jgi:hypothetical protein
MFTRNGKNYGASRLTQQQIEETLLDLVNHVGEQTKRSDVMWAYLFNKPESTGEGNKEGERETEEKKGNVDATTPRKEEDRQRNTTPHQEARHTLQIHLHDYTPNPRLELQPFMELAPIFEVRRDDFPKGVRVDVFDFHGALDPHAFQDWVTSLEDYFEWFNLSSDRQVRFVKMKLKGQARIWWHSVEECLHRLRQPPISDWGEMKMKLQEKYLPLDYEDSVFEELLSLRQGNLTVDEYTHRFHELSIRSRVAETDDNPSHDTRQAFVKTSGGN